MMIEACRFSIIIPVFNKWELTEACLKSLKRYTSGLYEVIVVDNGSSDRTVSELEVLGRSLFGNLFTAIRFSENKNFAPACNEGAARAKTLFLFFLNNDTIVTPGWETPLLDALDASPSLGAVGPLLLYENDTIQHMGIEFSPSGIVHLYRKFPRNHPVAAKPRFMQGLTAAALMIPKSIFYECGKFFEKYKNGFEDVELSLRIGQSGRRMKYIPSSVIYHLESQSAGRNAYERANFLLLSERCDKLWYFDKHLHALHDKFAIVWNAKYSLSALLNADDEAMLTKRYSTSSVQEQLAVLEANPLWQGGLLMAVNTLEKEGNVTLAALILAKYLEYYPTIAKHKQLLRLAMLAKLEKLQAAAESELKECLILAEERKKALRRVLFVQHRAEQFGDQCLLNYVAEAKALIFNR